MAADNPTNALADREAFGHWLSGFTDGEGNFHLTRPRKKIKTMASNTFQAVYRIGLRADDAQIVHLIREYFGCGNIYYSERPCHGMPNARRQIKFHVANVRDLVDIVIPHFDRFPLRAKKARDFTIWREAVMYIDRVQKRSRVGRNHKPRWYESDVAEMLRFKEALHQLRRFTEEPIARLPLGTIAAKAGSLPLFDGLSDLGVI